MWECLLFFFFLRIRECLLNDGYIKKKKLFSTKILTFDTNTLLTLLTFILVKLVRKMTNKEENYKSSI